MLLDQKQNKCNLIISSWVIKTLKDKKMYHNQVEISQQYIILTLHRSLPVSVVNDGAAHLNSEK